MPVVLLHPNEVRPGEALIELTAVAEMLCGSAVRFARYKPRCGFGAPEMWLEQLRY